jgi:hypothetical protein
LAPEPVPDGAIRNTTREGVASPRIPLAQKNRFAAAAHEDTFGRKQKILKKK